MAKAGDKKRLEGNARHIRQHRLLLAGSNVSGLSSLSTLYLAQGWPCTAARPRTRRRSVCSSL